MIRQLLFSIIGKLLNNIIVIFSVMIPKLELPNAQKSKNKLLHTENFLQSYKKTSLEYNRYLDGLSSTVEHVYKLEMLRNSLFQSKCNRELKEVSKEKEKVKSRLNLALKNLQKKHEKQIGRKQLKTVEATLANYEKMVKKYDKLIEQENGEIQKVEERRKNLRNLLQDKWKSKMRAVNELSLERINMSKISKISRLNTQSNHSSKHQNPSVFLTNESRHLSLLSSRKQNFSQSIIQDYQQMIHSQKTKLLKKKKTNQSSSEQLAECLQKLNSQCQYQRNELKLLGMFLSFLRNSEDDHLRELLIDKNEGSKRIKAIEAMIRNKTKIVNFLARALEKKAYEIDNIQIQAKKLNDQQKSQRISLIQ